MNSKIEELEIRLGAVSDDKEKVDVLNELAWELWSTDNARASQLTGESLELARKIEYEKGMAYARFNEGVLTWQTDAEKAVPYFLNALQWFREHGERRGEANATGILGIIYWSFGDFERGFELVHNALKLYREVQDEDGEGWAYNSLGAFHYDLKDHTQTLEYFRKGYRIFRKIGNCVGQARALNGIGNAYYSAGEYNKALNYQRKSLRISRDIKNDMSESRTLNDIGLIYQGLGNYQKALEYHNQSLRIRQEINYPTGESTTLMDLGNIYFLQEQYDKALKVLHKALILSEKIKGKPKIARAHSALSRVYGKLGNFEKALSHYKKYHAIEEQVFHEDSDQKLKSIKAAYQLEASQKEAEIYRLRNVELKEKNEQLEQTLKKLNATQAQLLQAGKMAALGNLVAGVVHEMNTPVGTIKSNLNVMERVINRLENALKSGIANGAAEKLRQMLQVLQQNNHNSNDASDRILRILQSLKSFSRLDEAKFQKADIHEGLESTLTLIEHEIKDHIRIVKEYRQVPAVYLYPDEINQVFMNLLMNAVQATGKGGTITIETYAENGHVYVKISDTGKGIPADKLEELFEPGFSSERSRVKMRTGLYTSYNIVSKHKGDIRVESEVGKGTTFTISIPTIQGEVAASRKGSN